jgi:glutamine amidotransferase
VSVALIDAGGANLGSVLAALRRLGAEVVVTRAPDEVARASHVILPGVGAAAPAMQRLGECGLDAAIRALSRPVLGICLGMQLLYERSDEGDAPCLGLIPGSVVPMSPSAGARIPHMGWNRLEALRESRLLSGVERRGHAYFVHSYAAPVDRYTIAACEHGDRFAAVVSHRNFHGFQFHPERSAAVGARLLRNFLEC